MTRTGLSPTLSQHRREPLVEVNPADAARLGLADGGLARLETAAGSSLFRIAIHPGQRLGELCVPMHWTDAMAREGRANLLVLAETDPHSGQPGFKDTPARAVAVQPAWRGFLATRGEADCAGLTWSSRARIAGGWLYELAGDAAPDPDSLLPDGERLEAADLARGMRRLVVRGADGGLLAALFLTRSGQLPARDWIAAQLGGDGASAIELLAGRPATPQPDRGPIVCVCHGIGAAQIVAAARAGETTLAGTNCGSCRPALARLLEEALAETMEAAE